MPKPSQQPSSQPQVQAQPQPQSQQPSDPYNKPRQSPSPTPFYRQQQQQPSVPSGRPESALPGANVGVKPNYHYVNNPSPQAYNGPKIAITPKDQVV